MCQTSFQTRATANEGAEAIPPIPKPPILDAVRADTPPAPRLSLDDDIPVAPLLRDDIPVAPRLPERHDLDETYDVLPVGDSPPRRAEPPPPPRRQRPSTPLPPRPPEGAPTFPTVSLAVEIEKDPDHRLQGRFEAEVWPGGFRMWRGAGRVLDVAPGGKAEYLGGNRFAIDLDAGRTVEMSVVGGDAPPAFLARAVAEFVSGQRDAVRLPSASRLPGLLLAAVPLGIPLLAYLFGNNISGPVGVILWSGLALALSCLCGLVASSALSGLGRTLAASAFIGMGYLFLLFGFAIDFTQTPAAIQPASWQTLTPVGGGYSVRMPPKPAFSTVSLTGFKGSGLQITKGSLAKENAFFVAGHGDFDESGLTAQQRMFLVKQALMQMAGTLLGGEREISLGGKSGREWTGQGPGEASSLLRVYTSDKRLYLFQAGCTRKKDVPALSAFLDSIQFDASREERIADGPKPGPGPDPGPRPGPGPGPGGEPAINRDLGMGGWLCDSGGKSFVWAGFVNNGRSILAVAKDGTIRRWNTATGGAARTFTGSGMSDVVSAAVSPDGRTVALAELNTGFLRLCRPNGKPLRILPARAKGSLWCVAFSPDGKTIATGHGNGQVTVWVTARGTPRAELTVGAGQVLSVAFSADGSTLAAAGSDRLVRIYEMPAGVLKTTCTGHRQPAAPWDGARDWTWAIRSVVLTRDGKTLLTASNDNTARVWDATTGRQKHLLAHPQPVTAAAFDPTGRIAYTACVDGRLRAWDPTTGNARATFRTGPLLPAGQIPRALAVSPDGSTLVVLFGDRVERWDLRRIPGAR
jgi:hypothetical protein